MLCTIQRGIVIHHTWFIPTFPHVYPHNVIRLSTCMSICISYVSNIPNCVWLSWLSELKRSSRVYIYHLYIYISVHLSIHREMVPCPPASFQGFRGLLCKAGVKRTFANPMPYAFLCYHLYIHEPIILHHAVPMVNKFRRLLNLITAVHHEPVNHLPYQLSIFWAVLLTRLAKKSSVGQLKLSRWRLGFVRKFMIASW